MNDLFLKNLKRYILIYDEKKTQKEYSVYVYLRIPRNKMLALEIKTFKIN